jgi:hypothetical protein
MKTAVSVPDAVFDAAEAVAQRLGLSRSQLYSQAVAEFVDKHRDDAVTQLLNRVYSKQSSRLDPALEVMQFTSLPDEDW